MTGNRSVRDEVLELLRLRSIRHIFGNPGTTELGLVSGLPSDIDYVLCLQEAIAVSAATGYSLMGGRPAVVNLHALPGVGHAIGALHGARLMHAPVVAIVGQQNSAHLSTEPLLSGDIVATARPATLWATQANRPEDVAQALERAFRVATTPPMGPALLAVPMDFWDQPSGDPVRASQIAPAAPASGAIDEVRRRLDASTRGALVVGDRINDRSSWDAAMAVAEAFDLAVYAAPIGTQPGFPTDHPRFKGNLPLVSGHLNEALAGHDAVVVAGAPVFTSYLFDGRHQIAPHVEIVLLSDDIEEASRAPAERIVLGDPGTSLVRLADRIEPASYEPSARDRLGPPTKLDLESVMAYVASVVPSDALFIDESMTAGAVVRRTLSVREPRQYLRTSNGVLGTGLPAAVGAGLSRPDRRIVAIVGDGSVMFAPQALWTAAQHDLAITFLVLNNGGYESLRGYERAHLSQREIGVPTFDITGIDLPGVAEAQGVGGVKVTTAQDLIPAIEDSFGSGGPTLIDIHIED